MIGILANWILSALALLIVANFVPGFNVPNFMTALAVALALGIVNALIRPILLLLTLPINILTLGLFSLVINAFLILLVAQFVKGFTVNGFVPALIAAVLLWILSVVINLAIFPVRKI